jgi:hypothetical protein
VLTPKIATVAARPLDGAWDRVKAVINRTAANLTTLRAGDRRREERRGKTENLLKQVQEEEVANPCTPPRQISEERGGENLFTKICGTRTNCF